MGGGGAENCFIGCKSKREKEKTRKDNLERRVNMGLILQTKSKTMQRGRRVIAFEWKIFQQESRKRMKGQKERNLSTRYSRYERGGGGFHTGASKRENERNFSLLNKKARAGGGGESLGWALDSWMDRGTENGGGEVIRRTQTLCSIGKLVARWLVRGKIGKRNSAFLLKKSYVGGGKRGRKGGKGYDAASESEKDKTSFFEAAELRSAEGEEGKGLRIISRKGQVGGN